MQTDFINAAIIQDEVLINIVRVIEDGWPASPLFLQSLGELVEAVVLHDHVYFDIFHSTQHPDVVHNPQKYPLVARLRESEFVQHLARNNAISLFPTQAEIDAQLSETATLYTTQEFARDYRSADVSFALISPDREANRYEILATVLKHAPYVFMNESLTLHLTGGRTPIDEVDPAEQSNLAAQLLGLGDREWVMLTQQNRRVRALVELAQHLGTNLCLTGVALPHQIGGVRLANRKARQLYERIVDQVESIDEPFGHTAFSRVNVPPLAQIAMSRALDSRTAIAAEIVNLRFQHREFRQYLTHYEQQHYQAKTRIEREQLQTESDNAWNKLLEVTTSSKKRLLYHLWDVVRKPKDVLVAVGDKVAERGEAYSVIDRVWGMYDFYTELRSSPVPEQNVPMLTRLFSSIAEESVWKAAEKMGSALDAQLIVGNPADPIR
jgi:hypothetical protein